MITHEYGKQPRVNGAQTEVVSTREALRAARRRLRSEVAVVMTMGALHDGHATLLRAARERAQSVIATIFVNPMQFGPTEDFAKYPRPLDADLELCRHEDVDLVFAPSTETMYPNGTPAVRVHPGPLGEILEGASRRGHFAGVLTVVLKLLHLTRPEVAFFGEKDFQQLALIRAMVVDMDLPVEIVGVPIAREPDGLARSSRNQYLSPADREVAGTLSRALMAGAEAGASGADAVLKTASDVLAAQPAVELDQLVLADASLRAFGPAVTGSARLLVAARVGGTRLIDNIAVEIG
ncbi:MAG: pantoate--beta-alanine ligase [Dactylosporangium sp.]|nr:pantoate--beta-alanine ligase [Dactylosporangium sp.]NNJ63017.1 pantoate--beta-alanine ligase [Dactylosporangium sp.]